MDVSSQPPAPGPAAVLVARNGRTTGQRRSIVDPFTLIGKASGCDLRLIGDSVAPFHCALVLTPAGPLLRALSSDVHLTVNGQQIEHAVLFGGDVIAVGAYEFGLEVAAPPTAEMPAASSDDDALRVQAAAVVAQQTALVEQELRLEQRATALAQQEEQLAAHLEQRRKELDEREKAVASLPEEVKRHTRQRKRLAALRRRLIARYRHAPGQRVPELAAREAELTARAAELTAREAEAAVRATELEAERERLRQWHEKVNGEYELRRIELEDRARELALDQQRWDAALNEEQAGRDRQANVAADQIAEVAAAQAALAVERKQWGEYHAWLSQETKGLEARIAAQREQLARLERHRPPAPVPAIDLPPGPSRQPAIDPARWPAVLREVAGQLGDQRAHLLEQWQHLLRLQDAWQAERDATHSEMEQIAAQLVTREKAVVQSERAVEARQAELQRRADAIARQRSALDAHRVRQAARDAAAEHALASVREELAAERRRVETRQRHYERVHQRRNELRRAETAALHGMMARLESARRAYHESWESCERLRADLDRQLRGLAGQRVALERAREELLGQPADPAWAARIELITRQEAERLEAEARRIVEERRRLGDDRSRLDEQAASIARREADLAERASAQIAQADAEAGRLQAAQEEAQAELEEARGARVRLALTERELRQLRDELDHVARAFYEDDDAAVAA